MGGTSEPLIDNSPIREVIPSAPTLGTLRTTLNKLLVIDAIFVMILTPFLLKLISIVFMESMACRAYNVVTIHWGMTTPNNFVKYTKGLTLSRVHINIQKKRKENKS